MIDLRVLFDGITAFVRSSRKVGDLMVSSIWSTLFQGGCGRQLLFIHSCLLALLIFLHSLVCSAEKKSPGTKA